MESIVSRVYALVNEWKRAGHAHGGQLRLPFLGPLVTGSMYGRRYASGLFEEGGTKMYISRELGFEGGGMPRARFLCRPEIASIELRGLEQGLNHALHYVS